MKNCPVAVMKTARWWPSELPTRGHPRSPGGVSGRAARPSRPVPRGVVALPSCVGEAGSLVLQLVSAGGHFGGAALHFGEFDEPALVEVDEAAPFGVGGGDLAVQPGQFGGEQFVVGDGGVQRDRLFAGQQLLGVGDRGADVVEHERVEGVGADVAFGAAARFAAGAQGVVVAAVVVAGPGAVGAAHLVAVGADAANTAFDESFEQPLAGFGAARAPLSVVGGDSAGGLEQLVGDDPGAVDRDPVVAVAPDLPVAAGGGPVGHRFGAVVVDPADVGLVAQQPVECGVAPGGFAGLRGHAVGVETATDLAHGDA